jgi:hypothetical protein
VDASEIGLVVVMSVVLVGFVARFVRRPDARARKLEAGAHVETFSTPWFHTMEVAWLNQSRHARVDVYEQATIITLSLGRRTLKRAEIRAIERDATGWKRYVRGPVTKFVMASGTTAALRTDDAQHERIVAWWSIADRKMA